MKKKEKIGIFSIVIVVLVIYALAFYFLIEKTQQGRMASFLKKNPELVFNVIKENPSQFFDVVRQASMSMGQKRKKVAQKKKVEVIQDAIEEGFKNPKVPKISKNRVFFGDKKAPVTIVEYSDFQCPYCARGAQTMEKFLKEYSGKVKVVYKHFPIKPQGLPAAQYYEAVALQSPKKAKEFHDKIFASQRSLSTGGDDFLKKVVKEIGGLDIKRVEKDAQSSKVQNTIMEDQTEARKFGVNGTPAFVINGSFIEGAYPYEDIKQIVDKHLEKVNKK